MGQDAALKNSHGNELIHTDVKLVTLSENHQKELLANYDLNSTVIPWHLDVSEFPELQENSIDILGVGSINQVKNYEDFIEVISAVAKTFPSLNVSILGDGEIRPRIERKIKDLQLENTITLLGHLPRAFVLEEMAQAKILLHTSSYESFGFVFLEALYSGMHIVSYNVGLAKTSATWHVCDNKTELIETCKRLLSENNSQKERVTIGSELETINAYLSLYHA
jgi:glycosyltransferase involved in cell wall biosynthesis